MRLKALLPGLVTNLVFLAILLGCAGRVDYPQAWLYVGIGVLMGVVNHVVLAGNPELERERGKPPAGTKSWDRKLLGLGLLLTIAMLVIAGLDSGRFHPRPAWPWSAVGVVLSLIGSGLFLWALKENRFFSSVVRIQSDRGHTVCTTGPYRFVRHPGNAGMIIGTLGYPFLMTSAWTALPALLSVAVLVVRTRKEDAMLQEELPGYGEYQRATRYRLVPGVW